MIYLIGLIIFIIIVFFAAKNKSIIKENEGLKPLQSDSYQPVTFMTDNEIEFFNRLIQAFPDYYIFPQVAMSALVFPKTNDSKQRNGLKNTYNRLRVDFVLYKDKKVIAVIELDDKTHKGKEEKDAKRDGILSQAKYQIHRFESTNKPSLQQLKEIIK